MSLTFFSSSLISDIKWQDLNQVLLLSHMLFSLLVNFCNIFEYVFHECFSSNLNTSKKSPPLLRRYLSKWVTKLRVKMLSEQGPLTKSKTLGENLSSYCCHIIHMLCILFILTYIRYCMVLSLWPPATYQSQFHYTLSWNFALVLVLLFLLQWQYRLPLCHILNIYSTIFCIFYLNNIF